MPGGWDGVRDMIRENRAGMPILTDAPTLLRETLLFPYLSGAEHIRQFKARRPGGWPFDSLPESTEQILHPEKYFDQRDSPTAIELPPLKAGARAVYENDLGEFETRILVYEFTRDLALATRAAAGWDGDRFILAALSGGGEGLVWASVWDSGIDAAEFVDVMETVLPMRYRGLKRLAGGSERRRFEGAGRTVEIRVVTIDGRPVVIMTDVPAGVAPDLIDPLRIRLIP